MGQFIIVLIPMIAIGVSIWIEHREVNRSVRSSVRFDPQRKRKKD